VKIILLFTLTGAILNAQPPRRNEPRPIVVVDTPLETNTAILSTSVNPETQALVLTVMGVPRTESPAMPFSAVRTSLTLQPHGSTMEATPLQRIYRDEEGRRRTESLYSDHEPLVEILDPVGGNRYLLEPSRKIAHWQRLDPGLGAPVPIRRWSREKVGSVRKLSTYERLERRLEWDASEEYLGKQLKEGIFADGFKITRTYPKGWQGSNKPLSLVTEEWFAVDIQEAVESTTENPDGTRLVTKLSNIKMGPPDAALFRTPADFQVTVQTGRFQFSLASLKPKTAEARTQAPNTTPLPAPILGKPYTGTEKIRQISILPNGTRITSDSIKKVYRDSKGRVRIELTRIVAPRIPIRPNEIYRPTPVLVGIEISDPITGQLISLDQQTIEAQKRPLTAVRRADIEETATGQTKNIRGQVSREVRRTIKYPQSASFAQHAWVSTELQVDMESTVSNESSEISTELQIESRTEPDPQLFIIPRGYLMRN